MLALMIHHRHVPQIFGILAIIPMGFLLAGITTVALKDIGRDMQVAYNTEMRENWLEIREDRSYELWMDFRGFWVDLMPKRGQENPFFTGALIVTYAVIEVALLIYLTFASPTRPRKTTLPGGHRKNQ